MTRISSLLPRVLYSSLLNRYLPERSCLSNNFFLFFIFHMLKCCGLSTFSEIKWIYDHLCRKSITFLAWVRSAAKIFLLETWIECWSPFRKSTTYSQRLGAFQQSSFRQQVHYYDFYLNMLSVIKKILLKNCFKSGASIPLRQCCIPGFRFPPYFRKIFQFSSAKISDDLFWSLTTNVEFPLYFCCFSTFPPYFQKIIISHYFCKFAPVFIKFMCFYILFLFFVSPLVWPWCIYASHNARTGRPCFK